MDLSQMSDEEIQKARAQAWIELTMSMGPGPEQVSRLLWLISALEEALSQHRTDQRDREARQAMGDPSERRSVGHGGAGGLFSYAGRKPY